MATELPTRDPARIALDFAADFVNALAQNGVTQCIVCPGSRSTPLTLAFAAQPDLRVWPMVDERSAGFFALGAAKARREPVAIVCTSGTAAANFLPAIVESYHAGVALLVLTADRPPELRDTGALQAIDQLKMYGSFVKWFFEMGVPRDDSGARNLARSVAVQAVARASSEPCGPVHVNFAFREPLVPAVVSATEPEPPRAIKHSRQGKRILGVDDLNDLIATLVTAERGLIVCGPQDDPSFQSAVLALGRATGFPILADSMSQLRSGLSLTERDKSNPQAFVIDNYDLFLRNLPSSARLVPDLVLRFGMTPTSKALLAFLGSADNARQISIGPPAHQNDPVRLTLESLDAEATALALALANLMPAGREVNDPWAEKWNRLTRLTRVVVDAHLAAMDELTELKVYPLLGELLPSDSLLYVGNSMPVRDLDAFFPVSGQRLRILGNRGVNGIDGVVSSALGAGATLDQRATLVIGDLSFYHDMNGLLAQKLYALDATIVLLNNNGGGIFHFLPQAEHPSVFETYFTTPTGLDFRRAVEMYHGRFRRPDSWEELHLDLVDSWTTPGLTVIEIQTNRDKNAVAHRLIWDAVAQAVDDMILDRQRA